MAIIDGLVSYWKMDETSGAAIDSHGSNHLSDVNDVATIAGVINGARDFELDSSQFFTIPSNASLQGGNRSFTIQAWYKIEATNVTRSLVSKDGGTGSGQREYNLQLSSTQTPRWFVYRASDQGQVLCSWGVGTNPPNIFCVHAWHDADNDQLGIAVNAGTAVTAAFHSGGVAAGSAEFRIGAKDSETPDYMDGWADEVGFWARVLTADERTALYNGGNGLSYSAFGGPPPPPPASGAEGGYFPGGMQPQTWPTVIGIWG